MRILHLASDDKFINHAYSVFDKAFPNKNEVWVFAKSSRLTYVQVEVAKIISIGWINKFAPKVASSEYHKYDIVVFHSFGDFLYPEIFNIPKEIPSVWLGWGYDYYGFLGRPASFLLPETRRMIGKDSRYVVSKAFRFTLTFLGLVRSKVKAIERVALFSPVLPNEYSLLYESREWPSFPEYVSWNYGTVEDHLLKGFEGQQVNGNAILVGNSAAPTNNHKEILDFLARCELEDRKVVAPLSYGSTTTGKKVLALGVSYFKKNFHPLNDFMPIQQYVAIVSQCGYVIMNHKRQQAVGNIIIMLYLGARVFLREENPTFKFLKDLGVEISSVQHLEKEASLLCTPLSMEEKESNKRLVSQYWSRHSGVARARALVTLALRTKCEWSHG